MEYQPGDLVWLYLKKERFPTRRKSKLMARGDWPFKVLAKVGANAYKLELPGDMCKACRGDTNLTTTLISK